MLYSTKCNHIFVLSTIQHISAKPTNPAIAGLEVKLKDRNMNIENTQSQMKKGILEFCILSIIRRGEAYPSDIVEEMRGANMSILEGTLYPLLTRLKNAEMLTYRWEESNSGPPRKYFSLTEKGEAFYRELEQTWIELSNAVNALTKKEEQPNS